MRSIEATLQSTALLLARSDILRTMGHDVIAFVSFLYLCEMSETCDETGYVLSNCIILSASLSPLSRAPCMLDQLSGSVTSPAKSSLGSSSDGRGLASSCRCWCLIGTSGALQVPMVRGSWVQHVLSNSAGAGRPDCPVNRRSVSVSLSITCI